MAMKDLYTLIEHSGTLMKQSHHTVSCLQLADSARDLTSLLLLF